MNPVQQTFHFLDALAANVYDETLHKVFADFLEEWGVDDHAEYHRNWSGKRRDAREFLERLAGELGTTWEELEAAGDKIADTGHFSFYGNDDAPGIMRRRWKEFLEAWQTYTGKKAGAADLSDEDVYFSCSC